MASLELIDRISERHLGLLSAYSSDLAFQQNKATLLGLVNSVVNTTRSCSSLASQSYALALGKTLVAQSKMSASIVAEDTEQIARGVRGRLWEEKNLAEEEERIFSQRETKRTEFGKPVDSLKEDEQKIVKKLQERLPRGTKLIFSDRKGVQESGLRSDIDEDVYSQMAGCCGNKETWERVESDDPDAEFLKGLTVAKPKEVDGKVFLTFFRKCSSPHCMYRSVGLRTFLCTGKITFGKVVDEKYTKNKRRGIEIIVLCNHWSDKQNSLEYVVNDENTTGKQSSGCVCARDIFWLLVES